MKITADMLSEAMGFTEKSIIEVNGEPCFFVQVTTNYFSDYSCLWIMSKNKGAQTTYLLEDIESIKVLTGPMSIWNHAPDWANSCVIDETGITWFERNDLPFEFIERPWWAEVKK